MSYRIEYDPECDGKKENSFFFRGILTVTFFVCFVWAVGRFWPEGRELLRLLVIPGDPDVTLEAAEAFARELKHGDPLAGAVERFAAAIVNYGTSG